MLSTMPRFQGGLPARGHRAFDRPRASIDPDDFRGGFAVWSGTSFAAPVLAGQLASEMCEPLAADGAADDAATAVGRAWAAVEECTDLAR